jgi:hypothetical protein
VCGRIDHNALDAIEWCLLASAIFRGTHCKAGSAQSVHVSDHGYGAKDSKALSTEGQV